MKNDIVKYIDLILDAGGGGGMASGATTTGDVAKNPTKGNVDVIGGECPEGQVYDRKKKVCVPVKNEEATGVKCPEGQTYDKKLKTCIQIEESIIRGYTKGKPFGKPFDMKKMADLEFETMLKINSRIRKRKEKWEYEDKEERGNRYSNFKLH